MKPFDHLRTAFEQLQQYSTTFEQPSTQHKQIEALQTNRCIAATNFKTPCQLLFFSRTFRRLLRCCNDLSVLTA